MGLVVDTVLARLDPKEWYAFIVLPDNNGKEPLLIHVHIQQLDLLGEDLGRMPEDPKGLGPTETLQLGGGVKEGMEPRGLVAGVGKAHDVLAHCVFVDHEHPISRDGSSKVPPRNGAIGFEEEFLHLRDQPW